MMKPKYGTILIILFLGLIAVGCSNTLDAGDGEPLTTDLSMTLPFQMHVNLWVENSYKTTVATLIDEVKRAGFHQVTFVAVDSDGNNLPEGTYTFRIETESFSESLVFHLIYD